MGTIRNSVSDLIDVSRLCQTFDGGRAAPSIVRPSDDATLGSSHPAGTRRSAGISLMSARRASRGAGRLIRISGGRSGSPRSTRRRRQPPPSRVDMVSTPSTHSRRDVRKPGERQVDRHSVMTQRNAGAFRISEEGEMRDRKKDAESETGMNDNAAGSTAPAARHFELHPAGGLKLDVNCDYLIKGLVPRRSCSSSTALPAPARLPGARCRPARRRRSGLGRPQGP